MIVHDLFNYAYTRGDSRSMLSPIFSYDNEFLIFQVFKLLRDQIFKLLRFYAT